MSSPDSEPTSFVRERDRVLTALVPAFVHRSNNALAIVHGALSLGGLGTSADQASGRLAAERLSELLAALSRFAKNPPAVQRTSDLARVLPQVEDLLGPLAETRKVELDVLPTAGVWTATFDEPRLVQGLSALLGAWILSVGGAGARVRLALRPARSGVALTLTTFDDGASDLPPASLGRLLELAAEVPFEVLARPLGRTHHLRLVLPAEVPAQARTVVATPARPRAGRLLLLTPVTGDGELWGEVLREHGFEVRHETQVPLPGEEDPPSDVVLADDGLEHERRGTLARLEVLLRPMGTPLGILGAATDSSRPALGKPVKPEELVAFAERLLAP